MSTKSRTIWLDIVKEKKAQLSPEDWKNVSLIESPDMFIADLGKLQDRHRKKSLVRVLEKANPVIERLEAFTKALNVYIQADGTGVASLVWGSVLVLVEIAGRYNQTSEKIGDMIQTLTLEMPRYEKYFELYPNNDALENVVRSIFVQYSDFCIFAINFFRKRTWRTMVRLSWGRLSQRFEECKTKITAWASQFKEEADLLLHQKTASNTTFLETSFAGIAITPLGKHGGDFNVISKENDRFTGREKELKKLQDVLEPAPTPQPSSGSQSLSSSPPQLPPQPQTDKQRSCLVHGLGGMGKTQVALKYAYASKDRFKYTFWIRAEDENSLADSYLGLGRRIGILRGPPKDLLDDIGMVRQWLINNEDWLIIFDNVENPKLLTPYWPACSHGSILLTSQSSALAHRTSSDILLQSLDPHQSVDIFRSHLNAQVDLTKAEQVATEVGGLPLLLVHLAGVVSEAHYSLHDILHILRERGDETRFILHTDSDESTVYQYVSTQSSQFIYSRPMEVVWNLALATLTSPARNVLNILSMLSPVNVPEGLFVQDLEDLELRFLGFQDKYRYIREVRGSITKRHLVDLSEDPALQKGNEQHYKYTIHRSLQLSILSKLDDDLQERQKVFDRATTLMRNIFPRPNAVMVPLHDREDIYELLVPHVLNLRKIYLRSNPKVVPTPQFTELLCYTGTFMYEAGLRKNGIEVLNTADELCGLLAKEALNFPEEKRKKYTRGYLTAPKGFEDSLIAGSLAALQANVIAYLAAIHWVMGSITDREEALQQAYKIVKLRSQHINESDAAEVTFSDRILLANSYSDLGLALCNSEEYAKAEEMCLKSLQLKAELSSHGGLPSFEYAATKFPLAYCKMSQGKVDEAIRLCKEAAADVAEEEGNLSVSTARFKFHLACMLANDRKYDQALDIYLEVMKVRMDTFGEKALRTLQCYYSVAETYYYVRKPQEALKYVKLLLDHRHDSNIAEPTVARALYLLSLIIRIVGDVTEADTAAREAFQLRDDLLKTHEPDLYQSVCNGVFDDPMIVFDLLVNTDQGRSTIGRLSKLGTSPNIV